MGSSCSSSNGCTQCKNWWGTMRKTGNCGRAFRKGRSDFSPFEGMDTNHDGYLYFDDILQERKNDPQFLNVVFHLVHILSLIDLDGDGKISEPEYNSGLAKTLTEDGSMESIFKTWDLDSNGRVTLPELIEATEMRFPDPGKALRDTLKKMGLLDSDWDSGLSLEELIGVMRGHLNPES